MNTEPPRYIWPRYVLAALVVGVVLSIIWMSVLVRRMRDQRDNMWPSASPSAPQTNAGLKKAQRTAEFRDTLSGGNAEDGRKVFFENPAASCSKCHKAGGQGGDNGPALDGIGARESREFILESILFPSAVINSNFQTVVAVLNGNTGVSGTLRSETANDLVLVTPEDGPVTIQKSDIRQRWMGASPMPGGIWQSLARQEFRDVIEFVATLKDSGPATAASPAHRP